MKTAILVDGAFYRMRAEELFGTKKGAERADELFAYCLKHLESVHEERELYRIFYYDCHPLSKKIYHPLLKRDIDFSQSKLHTWMQVFFDSLLKKRKVALRLGRLAEQASYTLRADSTRALLDGSITLSDLQNKDFTFDSRQKGVDMRIGLDIASMAYKKQVEQIILIAGDSDFVPAAKLARREGLDVILDHMGNHINADLHEHVDGIELIYEDFQKANEV